MSELWPLIRARRTALADDLETFTPEQWATPSLCEGWTVQDVAAHLAWAPALSPAKGIVELVRARFDPNRLIAETAVRWSARGPEAIVAQLRINTARNAKPTGVPLAAVLTDAVVHPLDIGVPLGLHRPVPRDAFVAVAEFTATASGPTATVLGGGPGERIHGLRLVADGLDWSHGHGADVRASPETLLLVLTGRPVDPAELSGPGAPVLARRL